MDPGDEKLINNSAEVRLLLEGSKPIANVTKSIENNTKKHSKDGRGKAFKQVLASFVANMGTINTGMAFGFPAVALPLMKKQIEPFVIEPWQTSWIASLSSAGTPFGCLMSSFLMDKIGRKGTLIVTEVPLIIGWLLIAFAQNVWMVYAGRFLTGFGSGLVGAPARVYTCEVAQPHLRGMLGALASVGVSSGVLIQYLIGSFTSWQTLAGISACIPIISLLSMLRMPESPNYLLTKNEEAKARKSLVRLRGLSCNVEGEISQMVQFKQKNHIQPLKGAKEIFGALMSPSTLKPFGILSAYFFIYQWSGVNAVTFYAVDMITLSVPTITNEYKKIATIALGVTRVIFTVVGCVACRKYGRRPLTMISAIGCGITMVVLGSYMYMSKVWAAMHETPQAPWVPILSIFLFQIATTIGFLIVPWLMIGEVYPTQVRGIVGGMTTCVAHGSVFIVVKSYEPMVKSWGMHTVFWIYSGITLTGVLFFWFFLPETKGRSLAEIEDYFCGRTKTLQPPKSQTSSC